MARCLDATILLSLLSVSAKNFPMFKDYYRGKKVLVTGHTGFKGSWLCQWLLKLGAEVSGVSIDVPTEPAVFDVLQLDRRVKDIRADILDLPKIKQIFIDEQPDIVFHLAAQPLVRASYDLPVLTFATNLMGTVNVLEAQRNVQSIRAVVAVTTDKVYSNQEWHWGYRESDALGGHDPYSASKACAEIAIKSYAQSYAADSKRIASVRAGNVIGGGDWALDRLIPDAVRAWSTNESLKIRSPQAVRPWQHVLEPLAAYLWTGSLLATKQLNSGEAFNFGPSREGHVSVESMLDRLRHDWKVSGKEVDAPAWVMEATADARAKKKETNFLSLNCDKAERVLEWAPVLTLNQSIQMTAQWYQIYFEKLETIQSFTSGQISQYEMLSHETRRAFAAQ